MIFGELAHHSTQKSIRGKQRKAHSCLLQVFRRFPELGVMLRAALRQRDIPVWLLQGHASLDLEWYQIFRVNVSFHTDLAGFSGSWYEEPIKQNNAFTNLFKKSHPSEPPPTNKREKKKKEIKLACAMRTEEELTEGGCFRDLHCYLGAYDRRLAATHCYPPLVASCYTLVRPTDTLSCCKSSVKKACLLIHSRGPQKNTPPEPWGLSPNYWKCTGSKQWLAEWATLSRSSLRTLRLATIARHLHPLTQKGKLRKVSFPCWL